MKKEKYLITDFTIGEKVYIKCEPSTLSDGITKIDKDSITGYHIGYITKFEGPRIIANLTYLPKHITSLPKTKEKFEELMKTLIVIKSCTVVEHLGKMSEIFVV